MAFTGPGRSIRLLLVALCGLITPAVPVKHHDFKTCDQSGFCRRNRLYADTATANATWESPYTLDRSTITFGNGVLTGTVYKQLADSPESVRLPLTVSFYQSGVARVTVDEERRQQGRIDLRHGRTGIRTQRYNEAEQWAIVGGTTPSAAAAVDTDADAGTTIVTYGPTRRFQAVIRHSPWAIDFRRDGETQMTFNGRGLLNVEHWRKQVERPAPAKTEGGGGGEAEGGGTDEGGGGNGGGAGDTADAEGGATEAAESGGGGGGGGDAADDDDESGWWDEAFGGHTDTKPKGPEAVALDISFPGYEHVYGISEHAGPLALRETRGGDGQYDQPYRMYNSDVFEYELDSPMTLYGSIPFMQAQKKHSTVGVFWLNAAETWVDITKASSTANPLSLGVPGHTTTHTHWISESGLLDVFVFLGPKPQDVIGAYTELTGTQQLPPHFAIASHQCRWNYVTDEDVRQVDRKFDRAEIPYDVIWLDIEYTDGKKYFTWDAMTFPDPIGMQKQLDAHGRKLVVIIDPHIKNEGGYHVVDEMKAQDLAVHNKDDGIYEGWCWPGSSHWVDCFSPAARKWWAGLFKYKNFPGTSKNVWLWNDMNEPSVFNGPEVTMPKDNVHHGGWEHRDVHNINGMAFVNATFEGLLARDKDEEQHNRRPFVLTRAFWSGSQRLGAMWTGDNLADWNHLGASIPMILSMGITGFPFAGADIGGFFGNPSKELLTRWYQAGIWYPFMRAHAHIDTRRREPYLAGEPYTAIITQAVRLRYSLLPAWYTAFHESHATGAPIVRPNYYLFPGDERGFAVDDQFYVGDFGLLVKPVTTEGQQGQPVYLADKEKYYDYFDFWTYEGPGDVVLASPLETIPLLMRGGHIIPRRDRPRRSSGLMKHDPITLVVVLGHSGDAEGTLYLDDGETYDHRDGAYIHRKFRYSAQSSSLSSEDLSRPGTKTKEYLKEMAKVRVEKIVVVGAPDAWKDKTEVHVSEEAGAGKGAAARRASLDFHAMDGGKAAWAVIRDPAVSVGSGWTIRV